MTRSPFGKPEISFFDRKERYFDTARTVLFRPLRIMYHLFDDNCI